MDDPQPRIFPSPDRVCADESGFTIIEVLVAAMILAIVAAGSAVAFVGAVGDSGIQRSRSVAEALAQQNSSRLRGDTVNQLANLNQTVGPVTIGGTAYTVQNTASFVSDGAGAPSCANPSADYLETTSTVTWAGMPSVLHGVTVTGLITPTAGQISSSAGVLAVQVSSTPGNSAIAGMPVSVTQTSGGSTTASSTTASNGCVLFADLPSGTYTVAVTPASGTYVDTASNQTVSSSSPDQVTGVQVTSGTKAANAQSFSLATPGTATLSFTDLWPSGVAPSGSYVPTATAPSVVLASGNLTATPSYVVCSNQDATCPAVGKADTAWGQSAWAGDAGNFTDGNLTATPLAPYSYNTYAGLCSSDDPTSQGFGGAYTVANVSSGQTATPSAIPLPSMVIRLWSGVSSSSPGSEIGMTSGFELVVTDTGCGEPFVGGPNVTVPTGDSYLPVKTTFISSISGTSNDTGVLQFPGMAYGRYTVCFQNGTKDLLLPAFSNVGNGEILNVYTGAVVTGTCQT